MSGDLAAVIMGCAAVGILIGFRIRSRKRRKIEKEELVRDFSGQSSANVSGKQKDSSA